MDLGKVTVFSGSPQQQSSPTAQPFLLLCTYSWSFNSTIWPCSLLLNFSRKPGRRSPSCAKMTPANPTMKGLEF